MIHLKYKCKVNFVKLPLIWIYRCLKLIFENATAGRNTGCRSVVNCAAAAAQNNACNANDKPRSWVHYPHITHQLFRKRVHTRACAELKNAHNSVTVQNRTHVYMNFFGHKDLGNHLLQLWHKVVKHPVYMWPPLWPSGQSFWLQIQRSRVRFPALPDFLSSRGVWNGVHSASWASWGQLRSYLNKKVAAPGLENRD